MVSVNGRTLLMIPVWIDEGCAQNDRLLNQSVANCCRCPYRADGAVSMVSPKDACLKD